jgi:hypothetical protein
MQEFHFSKSVLILIIGLLLVFVSLPIVAYAQEQNNISVEPDIVMQAGYDVVEVTDAASFLAAIQPNRTIKLLPGDYNLSSISISDIARAQKDYIDWIEGTVIIHNVDNFIIIANEPQGIYSANFNDTVISFENCNHLSITGITCGHHKNNIEGQCFAGVMRLSNCNDVVFHECDFYGCGLIGTSLDLCNSITFLNCIIRDCTWSAASLYESSDILFINTEIYGICTDSGFNDADSLFDMYNCKNVSFQTCLIHDNGSEATKSYKPMFRIYQKNIDEYQTFTMSDCSMSNNLYRTDVIKQIWGDISTNVNLCWSKSQMLKNVDNLDTQNALQSWHDWVLELANKDIGLSILRNDNDDVWIALFSTSKTVIKQFESAFKKLQKEVPDLYQQISDNGLIIFAQVSDEQEEESLEYNDGLFLFHCTPKQERILGEKAINNTIYLALANVIGKQVYLDAQSVTLQSGDSDVTGQTIVIDLASDINSLKLNAVVLPSEAQQAVTWHTSDKTIATVSEDGLVTGLQKGTVTITATAADGTKVKATCKVKVTYLAKEINITGKDTLVAGKNTTLNVEVLPKQTANKKVAWTSADTYVVAVNEDGTVTAKKITETRTVTITATARDGSGIIGEWIITVTPVE